MRPQREHWRDMQHPIHRPAAKTDARSVVLSWSGGKDSAMALARLQADPEMHVAALLTTITREFDRVSMHGVRRELLEAQAASLGLPLWLSSIAAGASNAEYETGMGEVFRKCRDCGIGTM